MVNLCCYTESRTLLGEKSSLHCHFIQPCLSFLKIILVFSCQNTDDTGNDSEKSSRSFKDDQSSRMCSVSTPLLYISVMCSFACLLLNPKGDKNKNGKRKRMETCKIVSSIGKNIMKYVLLSSSTGNDNTSKS